MILIKPIITENSMAESAKNRYAFEVDRRATKTDIKRVVERVFGLKVLGVRTVTVPGKSYRTGKRWLLRRKSDRKKAIITTEPGKIIDLFEITKQGQ